jgi:hypothetical protein
VSLLTLPWEARIPVAALRHGGGRFYRAGQSDEATTDCSRLVYAVLVELYGERVEAERAALMLWQGQPPWSPVEAVEKLGIATPTDQPWPGQWHLVQGWQSLEPLRGGHSFYWYEPPIPLAGVHGVQVQANLGVGAFVEADQSWEQQVARYHAGVRLAVLRDLG